jgi:hypothetical protein
MKTAELFPETGSILAALRELPKQSSMTSCRWTNTAGGAGNGGHLEDPTTPQIRAVIGQPSGTTAPIAGLPRALLISNLASLRSVFSQDIRLGETNRKQMDRFKGRGKKKEKPYCGC